MASAFSHAIASVAIGKVCSLWQKPDSPSGFKTTDLKFWILGMFCAVIPDADAIGYKLGVPYDSLWGHRGFTHSFFFAALLAFAVVYFFYSAEKRFGTRWWYLFIFFFLATASHPILDAMTTGGLGVAFFSPFDETRYFLPWRVIKVSPIGITKFFSQYGWEVLKSEFIWVWIPSFIIIGLTSVFKKLRTT